MEKYNLSDFGINKQIIKRKYVNDGVKDEYLETLLNRRETKYTIKELKSLIKILYSSHDVMKLNSNKPLSAYYAKKNKKKYQDLLELINLKQNNNYKVLLSEDIKKLVIYTENYLIPDDILYEKLKSISKKYSINVNEIERLFVKENGNRLNKINL